MADWLWALTLKQPVASAVMAGHKKFETRDFKPDKVQEFALHAGKGDNDRFQAVMGRSVADWPALEKLPRGILGVVSIVAVHDLQEFFDYSQLSEIDRELGYWNKRYAWELEIVDVYPIAIAARGQQGFWKWYPHGVRDGREYLKMLDSRAWGDGTLLVD